MSKGGTMNQPIDAKLCRAVAAWMQETVATEQIPMTKDGAPSSFEAKYPRIDSHSIYSVGVLATLPDGVAYLPETDALTTGNGRSTRLGSRTIGQMEEFEGASVAGPKGATFNPDASRNERVIGGFELSAKLDRLLTGEDAGAQFFGRGSAHRARVEHLAEQL